MEARHITSELRRLWPWVLLGVVLAALGAVSTGYRISPGIPPSFEEKSLSLATASTEVLVDSKKSALGTIDVDLEPLAGRAQVFARFASSAPIKKEIAQKLKISPAAIATVGPETPAPDSAGAAGLKPQDLVSPSDRYRLVAFSAEDSTIVNVFAQGPTVKQAVGLANAAATALSDYVVELDRRLKVRKEHLRIRLTQLGPADGGLVNMGANKVLAGLVFAGLLVVWCLLVLLVARVVRGPGGGDGLTREELERLLEPTTEGPADPYRPATER